MSNKSKWYIHYILISGNWMLFGIFVDQRRLIEATIFLILGYIATDLALNKVYPEVQEKNSK